MTLLAPLALAVVPALLASSDAPPGAADELVRAGRAALEAGRTGEARALFERALAQREEPALETWLVRTLVAEGRHEEALAATDRLRAGGAARSDVDYLVGLASLGLARGAIDAGRADGNTSNLLTDAQTLLARALAADPERFADAWVGLAEAAWRSGALDEAERALAPALAHAPDDAALLELAGRVGASRYQELRAADPAGARAARERAERAFARRIELAGTPADEAGQAALADVWAQVGHLRAWAASDEAGVTTAGAADAYVEAMAWDPPSVDFSAVLGALAAPAFADATARALERFDARHAAADARRATLSWWDGWAHWSTQDLETAAASFADALERWPAYTDGHYWLYRIDLARERFAAALEDLHAFARADRDALVAQLAGDTAAEVGRLGWLVGWCANPERHEGRARNDEAAFLCELLCALEPDAPRHWNNLGLFLRDHGDALRAERAGSPAELADLWERSLAAYERAVALEPENPNTVNDTAVLLHYYLRREPERARAMYLEAARLADLRLAGGTLVPDERNAVLVARRDARDNLRRLDAWLARVAAGETDLDPGAVR